MVSRIEQHVLVIDLQQFQPIPQQVRTPKVADEHSITTQQRPTDQGWGNIFVRSPIFDLSMMG